MRGAILGYDRSSHTGAISGHDGNRYDFALSEWKSTGAPAQGMVVDFVPVDGQATKIYVVDAQARRESWLGFLFSSQGRIPRKRFWLSYVLPVFGIYFLAGFLDGVISQGAAKPSVAFQGLAWLFFLWPGFAVAAKRLHDRGMNGWWAAVANGFLPITILAVAAYWYYTNKMRVAEGAASAAPDPGAGALFGAICLAFAVLWLYFVIQVAFVRGQVGENKYGDDPLPTSADVRSDNTVTAVFGSLSVVLFLILPISAYWYYSNKMQKVEGQTTAPQDNSATQGNDTQLSNESEPAAPTPEQLGLIPLEDGAVDDTAAAPTEPDAAPAEESR